MIVYHQTRRTQSLGARHVFYVFWPIQGDVIHSGEGGIAPPTVSARQRYFIANVGTLMGMR